MFGSPPWRRSRATWKASDGSMSSSKRRGAGVPDVEVIDDDLGRSASGMVARPGFERLVAWLCAGKVGAVLCFDASRLARNGRDWHHLLEPCGLVGARVIELDGDLRSLPAERSTAAGHEGQDYSATIWMRTARQSG